MSFYSSVVEGREECRWIIGPRVDPRRIVPRMYDKRHPVMDLFGDTRASVVTIAKFASQSAPFTYSGCRRRSGTALSAYDGLAKVISTSYSLW